MKEKLLILAVLATAASAPAITFNASDAFSVAPGIWQIDAGGYSVTVTSTNFDALDNPAVPGGAYEDGTEFVVLTGETLVITPNFDPTFAAVTLIDSEFEPTPENATVNGAAVSLTPGVVNNATAHADSTDLFVTTPGPSMLIVGPSAGGDGTIGIAAVHYDAVPEPSAALLGGLLGVGFLLRRRR